MPTDKSKEKRFTELLAGRKERAKNLQVSPCNSVGATIFIPPKASSDAVAAASADLQSLSAV